MNEIPIASTRRPDALVRLPRFMRAPLTVPGPNAPSSSPGLLLLAAAAAILPSAAPATASALPVPPKLRLPEGVRPLRYDLDLSISPERPEFQGRVGIEVVVRRASSVVWLNARNLKVSRATVSSRGKSQAVRVAPGGQDFVGLIPPKVLTPGKYRLDLTYQGKIDDTDANGLFRRTEGAEWYVFSQLEPLGARRSFPCFDEPAFKVPWRLTLRVPSDYEAFANTPAVSMKTAGRVKTVQFAETRPIPSYLVALAVGPFEAVEAGRAGRKQTPIRIIVPRGRRAEAAYSARVTPKILEHLETYFGTPYPYEKLDQIAVPQFFGAMENPGLVTYYQSGILASPGREPLEMQRDHAGTVAHELAHQWFGNLVTMRWWDDLWLNEAFATWLSTRIVDRWKPEWKSSLNVVIGRNQWAMYADSVSSARRIRQPIHSEGDIHNAFDGITYSKGAAVLDMLERWLGPEVFRRGVRDYMQRHAWGNATAEDFIAAQSRAAGKDLRPVFRAFLDQTGLPLLTIERSGPRSLRLTQSRYLPLGSPESRTPTWDLPVRLRIGVGGKTVERNLLLTSASETVTVPGTPVWVIGNAGQGGYYRVLYRGDLLRRLVQAPVKQLSTAEQAGLIGDLAALTRSGDLPADTLLEQLPTLFPRDEPHLARAAARVLEQLHPLLPEDLRPAFAGYLQRAFGGAARGLGWSPQSGESEETRLLRPMLLELVGMPGRDAELGREARRRTQAWLTDRTALAPELVEAALNVAARHGDRVLFDAFHREAKRTTDPRERVLLLRALARFPQPELLQAALALTLTEEVHAADSYEILEVAGRNPMSHSHALQWLKQHYTALRARHPEELVAELPELFSGFAEEARAVEVEQFFRPRTARLSGGERSLAQTLERIRQNAAIRRAQGEALRRALR